MAEGVEDGDHRRHAHVGAASHGVVGTGRPATAHLAHRFELLQEPLPGRRVCSAPRKSSHEGALLSTGPPSGPNGRAGPRA